MSSSGYNTSSLRLLRHSRPGAPHWRASPVGVGRHMASYRQGGEFYATPQDQVREYDRPALVSCRFCPSRVDHEGVAAARHLLVCRGAPDTARAAARAALSEVGE